MASVSSSSHATLWISERAFEKPAGHASMRYGTLSGSRRGVGYWCRERATAKCSALLVNIPMDSTPLGVQTKHSRGSAMLGPGGRFAFVDWLDDPKLYDARGHALKVIASNRGEIESSRSLSEVL